MRADLEKMKAGALYLETDPDDEAFVAAPQKAQEAWASAIRDGVAELEERRREPVADTGPSVEERLQACRMRAAVILGPSINAARNDDGHVAVAVERMAHAMLAAERPPSATEPSFYNTAHRHGQESGARAVLAALEERVRDDLAGMTATELADWIMQGRARKWAADEKEEG